MPDAIFAEPRLAAVYDVFDPDRSDLDVYVDLVAQLGARSVLDVGCGTGTFALMLADRGLEVVGVDPAAASLAVARAKLGSGRVRWLDGDASTLPPMRVDLATMTGNVAQAIVDPVDWGRTLEAIVAAVRPGGHVVLETRDPAARGWEEWTRAASTRVAEIPDSGQIEHWVELVEVRLPLVRFRGTWVFDIDGAVLHSESTLRFREREEVVADLAGHGLSVVDVRDAPDRPGRELVFVARRQAAAG